MTEFLLCLLAASAVAGLVYLAKLLLNPEDTPAPRAPVRRPDDCSCLAIGDDEDAYVIRDVHCQVHREAGGS